MTNISAALVQTRAEPWWYIISSTHTYTHFIQSHFNTHSNFQCFLFIFLSLENSLTQTHSTLLQVSEYQALGFLYFAGWGNDMVLTLTVVVVKQQILFPTRLSHVFVWGDGMCVVIWRFAISPQSHCHHPWPPIADNEQYFVSPRLVSSQISFLSDWNSPFVFSSSPFFFLK